MVIGTPGTSTASSDSRSEELVQSHLEKLKETHQIEKMQVCVIGSGNWGSTTAKIIGENILTGKASRYFSDEVRMWVFEEDVKQADGSVRKLSEIINVDHTNVNLAVHQTKGLIQRGRSNFGVLVLGCTEAKLCNPRLIFQLTGDLQD